MSTSDGFTERSAIERLRHQGFVLDYRVAGDAIADDAGRQLRPEDLEVQEVIRVEGASDADDQAMILGLETDDGQRGVLVTSFGPGSNPGAAEVVRRLPFRHRGETTPGATGGTDRGGGR
jgi:hypothetical protein